MTADMTRATGLVVTRWQLLCGHTIRMFGQHDISSGHSFQPKTKCHQLRPARCPPWRVSRCSIRNEKADATSDHTRCFRQAAMGIFLRYPKRVLHSVPNGLFLRGLPHESTVRGLWGFCWASYIISAQWSKTLAGCLMSPPCGSCWLSCGLHISSSHSGTVPLRAAS